MENLWLHRFALLVSVCTLLLVVAGASVTSNDAGLSVPDWPLSYGRLMPQMTGGVFFEHGHRMIATTVGLLTIVLAVWLWRAETRRWLKWLGVAALGAVIAQGLLGGLTVLFLLPRPVSIAHACLAQLFFSTTMAIALFTSAGWKRGPQPVEDAGRLSLRALAVLTSILALVQSALGAAYRHQALGLVPHVTGALVLSAAVLLTAIFVLTSSGGHRALAGAARALLAVTFLQVFLGIAAYMSRISSSESGRLEPSMVWFTVLHVAVGAMVTAHSVILAIQVHRNVQPAVP